MPPTLGGKYNFLIIAGWLLRSDSEKGRQRFQVGSAPAPGCSGVLAPPVPGARRDGEKEKSGWVWSNREVLPAGTPNLVLWHLPKFGGTRVRGGGSQAGAAPGGAAALPCVDFPLCFNELRLFRATSINKFDFSWWCWHHLLPGKEHAVSWGIANKNRGKNPRK